MGDGLSVKTQAELYYLLSKVEEQYNFESKQTPRKGSYQMGSRIGKLSVLGEMKNSLQGIIERMEAEN